MKPEIVLAHEFVEYIPEELNERTLYISRTYGTAVHKCCCGCGREVVTPLSPTAWQLTFDGKSVSLYPSIGSWSLPCQSHYFITKNRVVWSVQWTKQQINRGRAQEAMARERHFETANAPANPDLTQAATPPTSSKPKESLWQRIKRWFS
ncbi:MAG: hypothetical protein JNJ77_18610 [Planctomycetia bacterium]|jgi:hypothetical protein|nr:hypothetical protein [Planctomycetia bacterium]